MHIEDKWDSDNNKVLDIVERDTWSFFRALLTNDGEIFILSTLFCSSREK